MVVETDERRCFGDDIKIRKIYENYGFQELQKEDDLVQYIKFI